MDWVKAKLQLPFLITRDAILIWIRSNPFSLAAALSYYAMLSLAPLVVIALAIAGQVYGEQLAESELINQIAAASGDEVATAVRSVIENTSQFSSSLVAGLISVVVLLIGASSAFSLLSDTINVIWGVPVQRRSSMLYTIRQRVAGIIMALCIGFLLIGSLAISAAVSTLTAFFADRVPAIVPLLVSIDESWGLFIVFAFIFAAMFKVLTEADNWWLDVWIGGVVTATLFSLNKWVLRIYLIYSTITAVYGAAGSLVVLLIWVYNTGLIISFGAALCRACATHYGSISSLSKFMMTTPAHEPYAREPRTIKRATVRRTLASPNHKKPNQFS